MTASEDAGGDNRACTLRQVALEIGAAACVDLAGSSILEICVPLLEHERADCEFDGWPGPVKLRCVREFNAWRGRNPQRVIVMISTAFAKGCCVLMVHSKT